MCLKSQCTVEKEPDIYLTVIKQHGIHNALRFCLSTNVVFFLSFLYSASVHFWITQSCSCQVTSAHRLINSIWFLTFSHNIGFIFILILILNLFGEGNWNMQQKFSLNIKVYPRFRGKKKYKPVITVEIALLMQSRNFELVILDIPTCRWTWRKPVWFPFCILRQNILQDVKKALTQKIGFLWRPVVNVIADIVLCR